jgi:hypothetical protein
MGEAATEAAVRQRIPGAYVVHLATHGYFNQNLPMSSGVLLAPPLGDADAGTANDGVLQAWEFGRTLPLSAELVVLSACETGRGLVSFRGAGQTPFDVWAERGDGGHLVVKRLRSAATRLTPRAMDTVLAVMQTFLGKRYDRTFEWSDTRMYCSELVWKTYERSIGVTLGEPQRLGDFDLTDSTVHAALAKRYGTEIPVNEKVISPIAIFDSPLLELAARR